MILRITAYGEPVLREKGARVEQFDEHLRQLAKDMIETMYAAEGVGLAAQQIGLAVQFTVIDARLPDEPGGGTVLFDGKPTPVELLMPMALANPQIELLPGETVVIEEGCLSFPGIRAEIERPDAVRVTYQDLDGAKHTLEADGWPARILQHEIDHLHGTLFIDRMKPRVLRPLEPEVKALEKETRERLRLQG